MDRKLPEILTINEDYEIQEWLNKSCARILLSPSSCYLDDDIVCLEEVIRAIVQRYNEHDVLLAYTGYVDACKKVGKRPKHYRDFRKMPVFAENIKGIKCEHSFGANHVCQFCGKMEWQVLKRRECKDIEVIMNHPPEGYSLEFIEEIQAAIDKVLVSFGFARLEITEVGEKTSWSYYQFGECLEKENTS